MALSRDEAAGSTARGHAAEPPAPRRFAVVHWGARLHYAVPQALHRANALRVLYTDWHAGSALPRRLGRLDIPFDVGGSLRRGLARRVPDEIPRAMIRSHPLLDLQQALYHRLDRSTARLASAAARRRVGSHALGRRLLERDFEGANALYVHACASTEAVKAARSRGIFVVLEAISTPFHRLVEREEYLRFGRRPPFAESEIRDNIDFFAAELDHADLVLAASTHVAQGLHELGVARGKVAVVPYGYDGDRELGREAPVPGRVAFVGKVGYLKGVPYLAGASRELARRGLSCDFRVLGACPRELTARPEFLGPRYVGQVPRDAIRRELRRADMLVFPTLSDGFGIVLLEAMAAGLPVIATANCADVVEDGVNGFVVPARDPVAIADRVELLTRDRDLRNRLGADAKKTAGRYDIDRYCRRLRDALAAHLGEGAESPEPARSR